MIRLYQLRYVAYSFITNVESRLLLANSKTDLYSLCAEPCYYKSPYSWLVSKHRRGVLITHIDMYIYIYSNGILALSAKDFYAISDKWIVKKKKRFRIRSASLQTWSCKQTLVRWLCINATAKIHISYRFPRILDRLLEDMSLIPWVDLNDGWTSHCRFQHHITILFCLMIISTIIINQRSHELTCNRLSSNGRGAPI